MTGLLPALLGVLILLFVCGLLSMIEIALVLCRESRLLPSQDDDDARGLVRAPDAALSLIQGGITLAGVAAGALAADGLTAPVAAWLRAATGWGGWLEAVLFPSVLILVTLALILFGELLPKRVGLAYPETVVRVFARPLTALGIFAGPIVRGLDRLADALAGLLHLRAAAPETVSEDELKLLVREGGRSGALLPEESEMVEAVLGLDRLRVRELMTPRNDIVWLDAELPTERWLDHLLASGHSHLPMFRNRRDNLLGVIALRDVFAALRAGQSSADLRTLAKPPLLVPPTQPVLKLLDTFRNANATFAVVADEFGGITGVVTLHDAIQAIVGDFQDTASASDEMVERADGSWLVDASVHPDEFSIQFPGFPFAPPEDRDYVTMNGYILHRLGRIPVTGETFEAGGYRIEVIDLDRHRVDKMLVSKAESKERRAES